MRPRWPLISTVLLASACAPKHPTTPAPQAPVAATTSPSTSPTTSPTTAPAPAPAPAPTTATAELSEPLARPCPVDSEPHTRARDELSALTTEIAALAPEADPKPLTARIKLLIHNNPCFDVLLNNHPGTFTSSRSLREFWTAGGHAWLAQVLRHAGPEDDRYAWIAPTPRKSLSLEDAATHPLADLLLCSQRDPACGAETEPWRRRATTFLTMFDRLRQLRRAGEQPDDPMAACEARALAIEPVEARYSEWHACFLDSAIPHSTLPLGKFRAPRDGWLIVRGRRGHYGFCDEVRAYDLATGAAYIAQSCSGLALTDRGGVDGARTDAARKPSTKVGRLPLDALREAAWMMALADETQRDVIDHGHGWHIPSTIPIVVPAERSFSIRGGSFSHSSNQTTLHWSWARAGRTVTAGKLTWPEDHNHAAHEHAVRLLDIAEAGLLEGCAPARLPDLATVAGKPPGVSSLDADPTSLSRTQADLMTALTGLRSAKRCPPR